MKESLAIRTALSSQGRRLGALLARWEERAQHGSARRSLTRIAAAFPSLPPDRRHAIAAESQRLTAAARWDARWLARCSTETLCRQISLEGWEPIARAMRAGRGLVVVTAAAGSAEIAMLAAKAWAAPIAVLRFDRPAEGRGVPILAGAAEADSAIGREAGRHNAPIVPLFALPAASHRYRLLAGTEIPATTPPAVISARLTTELERIVRARPEVWPWR